MTTLLIISLIITAALLGGASIGAAIDDFRAIRRRGRASSRHPLEAAVTVLLVTNGNDEITRRTLTSLLQSSYKRLEIILISTPRSRPALKKTVASLSQPDRTMTVYTGTKPLVGVYHRYGHGEIILTLQGNEQLDRHAITRAVRHFDTAKDIAVIHPNVIAMTRGSTMGLLQTYADGLLYFWRKVTNLAATPVATLTSLAFYRRDAFLANPKTPLSMAYFADDVIARRTLPTTLCTFIRASEAYLSRFYLHPVYSRATPLLRRVGHHLVDTGLSWMLLATPLILSYALLLAFSARQPLLLFVITGVIGIYTLVGVWSSAGRPRREKAYLSLLLPICFIPLYVAILTLSLITIRVFVKSLWSALPAAPALFKKPLSP